MLMASCGVLLFIAMAGSVVYLAQRFSVRMPMNAADLIMLQTTRPLDYDNRWPGYPLRPGDKGYTPYMKGEFGNLPPQVVH